MGMITLKLCSALVFGFLGFSLTGSSGILWSPGSGSSGSFFFTIIAFVFGGMLPTEIAFWKSRKRSS